VQSKIKYVIFVRFIMLHGCAQNICWKA